MIPSFNEGIINIFKKNLKVLFVKYSPISKKKIWGDSQSSCFDLLSEQRLAEDE
jgi:hypothetical protein